MRHKLDTDPYIKGILLTFFTKVGSELADFRKRYSIADHIITVTQLTKSVGNIVSQDSYSSGKKKYLIY